MNDLPLTLSKHLKSQVFGDEIWFHDHSHVLFRIDLTSGDMRCDRDNRSDIYAVDESGRLIIIGVDIIE